MLRQILAAGIYGGLQMSDAANGTISQVDIIQTRTSTNQDRNSIGLCRVACETIHDPLELHQRGDNKLRTLRGDVSTGQFW